MGKQSMPALGECGGMLPQEILKNFTFWGWIWGQFSNLSTFDVPVDTGTQNFLKCTICMPIRLGNVAEINIY